MLGNRLACVNRAPQLGSDSLHMIVDGSAVRRHEHADAGDAGSPSPSGFCRTFDGHAADGQHRNARRCMTCVAKIVERGTRMARGFRSSVVHGPENQVIDASDARRRTGIRRAMHRLPDNGVFTEQ